MKYEKRKRISIRDVAKEAGVSVATVSRVINDKDGGVMISEKTRKAVLETTKKLNYQIDPFAAALRTGRSGLIGAIVRDAEDPFLIMLIKAIQNRARQEEIDFLVGYADFSTEIADRNIDVMINHFFDGVFLIGDISGDQSLIEKIEKKGTPYVIVAHGMVENQLGVNVDENKGVSLAIDYFLQLGHKKIATMGDPSLTGTRQRLEIFQQYFRKLGFSLKPEYIQECKHDRQDAAEKVMNLFNTNDPPTAIFCTTDVIALGAINRLIFEGIKVPGDVSIIGFDNIKETETFYPSITTIDQRVDEMSSKVMNILKDVMKDEKKYNEKKCIKIEPELVIRNSCKRLK